MDDDQTSADPRVGEGLADVELAAFALARHQIVSTSASSLPSLSLRLTGSGRDHISDEVRRAARDLPSRPLHEVLEARRSNDVFEAMGLEQLLAVLVRSYRVQDAGVDHLGSEWSLRPVPSAGATHSFDLLVIVADVRDIEPGQYLFDAHRGGLQRLDPSWNEYADALEKAALLAARRLDPAPATILLVAATARITARYSSALTLLLRDAGVLLQTLHLVATDLGLASRILGTAGHSPDEPAPGTPAVSPTRSETPTAQATQAAPATQNSSRPLMSVVDCGALILGA